MATDLRGRRTASGLLILLGVLLAACGSSNVVVTPGPSTVAALATPAVSAIPSVVPSPSPSAAPTATPTPLPTPSPTPVPAIVLSHCTGKAGPTSGTAYGSTDKYFAGYLDYGSTNNVTCVEASWVQPAITCAASDSKSDVSFSVTIAGYDGHGTSSGHQRPERAATEAYCDSGIQTYIAWTLTVQPNDTGYHETSFLIRPGDHIWAQVKATGHTFKLSIGDLTINQISSTTASVKGATREDADWMVQSGEVGCPKKCAPGPLASFGTVHFTGAEATINGVLETVDRWARQADTMATGSMKRAVVSHLGRGSFSITWRHK